MFTENQVRQFYVAKSAVAPAVNADASVAATDAAGKTQLVIKGDEAYFLHKGASADGLQRSDLIKKCNVMDVRLTDAADMVHKMKAVLVKLNNDVNSGAPIVGQDYLLNVDIHNYIAMDYNTTKNKYGVAKALTTTASDLYKALAVSLAKNFKREPVKLVSIFLQGINGEVDGKQAASAITGTATGIIIAEAEQPWRLGAAPQEFVNFEVNPSTVYIAAQNADLVWGTVTDYTATYNQTLPNSKKVADMEYFFHKERGDKYGMLKWPWNIDTEYMVDPANADGYSFVDIHFYFEGNSHNVGHSEKTLTIVGTKANLKTLVGSAATTGQSATAATGLFAWLEGTDVNIKTSTSW